VQSKAGTVARPPWTGTGATRWAGLGVVAFVASLLGGLAGGMIVATYESADNDSGANTGSSRPAALTVEQTSAIAEVASSARPGVVRIESVKSTLTGQEQDIGSGVVLDTAGHIITNAHVVIGTDSLKVVLADGTERPAILVGHDFPFTDLAVLQIGPGNLQPIPPGDSGSLRLGETVIAIGNPLAEFDGSVSVGVVSGLDRVRVFDAVRQDDLIQTDAAVNSGNSGGALLNLSGQFVGMPTAVLRQSRSGSAVEGIAFALPSNRVMEIANRIIANGGSIERPSLGIEHIDITAENIARLPRTAVSQGTLVAAVAAGGPAAGAGIRPGDVITRLGDVDITRELPLYNALMAYAPGDTVRVVLNRNGRIIDVEVRLGKHS
jgi:2-alkenal reductase